MKKLIEKIHGKKVKRIEFRQDLQVSYLDTFDEVPSKYYPTEPHYYITFVEGNILALPLSQILDMIYEYKDEA